MLHKCKINGETLTLTFVLPRFFRLTTISHPSVAKLDHGTASRFELEPALKNANPKTIYYLALLVTFFRTLPGSLRC